MKNKSGWKWKTTKNNFWRTASPEKIAERKTQLRKRMTLDDAIIAVRYLMMGIFAWRLKMGIYAT